jgi:glutathione S-transferase
LGAFKSAKLDPSERPAGFDAQLKDLHMNMKVVSDHLEGKEFVALGKLTIADIALSPILGRCLNFPYDRPSMFGLETWFESISARTAFQTATAT